MKWVGKFYRLNKERIVTNIWDADAVMIPEGDYVELHQDVVTDLNNAIVAGKKVRLKAKANEKKILGDGDFVIVNVASKEIKRKKLMEMLSAESQQSVGLVSAIDFFEYLELFVQFLEKGIYITNKNREEKYLEVINTGDVDTIAALERYLEIRDNTLTAVNSYKNTKSAMKRAFTAKTEKEIDVVYDEYKRGCA
jgi:hypothetical protein